MNYLPPFRKISRYCEICRSSFKEKSWMVALANDRWIHLNCATEAIEIFLEKRRTRENAKL